MVHLDHDRSLRAVLDHRRQRDLGNVQLFEIGQVSGIGGELDSRTRVVAENRQCVHRDGHTTHHHEAKKTPAAATPVDIHLCTPFRCLAVARPGNFTDSRLWTRIGEIPGLVVAKSLPSRCQVVAKSLLGRLEGRATAGMRTHVLPAAGVPLVRSRQFARTVFNASGLGTQRTPLFWIPAARSVVMTSQSIGSAEDVSISVATGSFLVVTAARVPSGL